MSTIFLPNSSSVRRLFFVISLSSLSYFAGLLGFPSYWSEPSTKSYRSVKLPDCVWDNHTAPTYEVSDELHFEAHHFIALHLPLVAQISLFPSCPSNFSVYCPCHDRSRAGHFSREMFFHLERHCIENTTDKHRCLVPAPSGYRKTFSWPKSRDNAWYGNVPSNTLIQTKRTQNWIRRKGNLLIFPGGGTSFPDGVKRYVQEILRFLPLKSGSIRTVLDVGCGVASFGAFMFDYNILTMSIAPNDQHRAQVQFALERGVPAMLEVLGTYRLSYPSRAFDMVHCSRCLVNWTGYGGIYLMEIDRVLRPGGYWVLSGPPINWKVRYSGWNRTINMKAEKLKLEGLAKRLCWNKMSDIGDIAIWQKPHNHVQCIKNLKAWKSPRLCAVNDPDAGWYETLTPCVTPLPEVRGNDVAGGALEKWPQRLNVVPYRLQNDPEAFNRDRNEWNHRIKYYETILKSLSGERFRNIMDMNAGFGGFAAAMIKYPTWVMNVLPPHAKNNLSIVYERGLIGTYMNWCEAFSTYPRTYDLLHAYGVFSMYKDRCDIADILLEMYRILRPEGAIIIRDHIDTIVQVKKIAEGMKWMGRVLHSEKGEFHSEKIYLVDNSLERHQ